LQKSSAHKIALLSPYPFASTEPALQGRPPSMQTGQASLVLGNGLKIIDFLLPWTFAIGSM